MLSTQGAAELQYKIGYGFGDGLHLLHAVGVLEVDQGSDVKAPDTRVAVVRRLRVVTLDDFIKATSELSKAVGVNGGILYKGDGLSITTDTHEQPEPRLPDGPSLRLVLFREQIYTGVADSLSLHVGLEGLYPRSDLSL